MKYPEIKEDKHEDDHDSSISDLIKEIKKVPDPGTLEEGKGVMNQIKKVVRKFRENEKYK